MRVLYIHQYFNTPEMSGGTRSYELAKSLVQNGHKVTVISADRAAGNGSLLCGSDTSGIDIVWVKVAYANSFSFMRRAFSFVSFSAKVWFASRKLDYDLVFATSTPLTVGIPGVLAARRYNVPLVFEVRDLWPDIPIALGIVTNPVLIWALKRFEKWVYSNSSAIIALSPGMKDGISDTGFDKRRIGVIPNACDRQFSELSHHQITSFMQSRRIDSKRPILLYAGTFGFLNGLSYAVDLAFELSIIRSNVLVVLVGDGAEKSIIERQAKNLGVLGKNLIIEGRLSKNEIGMVFRAATMGASLFIDLPEMRANSANKFFDTLAAGKPVFVNYGGWMHSLIETYRCGFSGWNMGLDEVAFQIDCIMNDQSLLDSYAEGVSVLSAEFARDKLASQFEKILVNSYEGRAVLPEEVAPGKYW